MKKFQSQIVINIEALYISMACVFFIMSIIRLISGVQTSHEWSHFGLSCFYLIIGVIYLLKQHKGD